MAHWLRNRLSSNRRISVLIPFAQYLTVELTLSGTLGLLAQQQDASGKRAAGVKQGKQRMQAYAEFLGEMSSYFQEVSSQVKDYPMLMPHDNSRGC